MPHVGMQVGHMCASQAEGRWTLPTGAGCVCGGGGSCVCISTPLAMYGFRMSLFLISHVMSKV